MMKPQISRSRKRLVMYAVFVVLVLASYYRHYPMTTLTPLSNQIPDSDSAFLESYLKQETEQAHERESLSSLSLLPRSKPQKRRGLPQAPPIRINSRLQLKHWVRTRTSNTSASNLPPAPSESSSKITTTTTIPPYIQQHCNLSGVPDWMPPANDWRRRVPRFLILGAKKGGTTGVFASLVAHPHVLRGKLKELLYFIPVRFPHWANDQIGQPVQVGPARQQLWQEYFATNKLKDQLPRAITGEATPDYLLYSTFAAQAILCSVPWAKMIVLLREPIDRMFSHYNFMRDPHRSNQQLPPFETWIRNDIRRLQSVGVLPQNLADIPQYMNSPQERLAWERYQLDFGKHLMDRPVARSLYAIQLEEWIEAFRQVGKDPATDLKVILSEEIKRNATVTQELLQWLGVQSTVRIPPKDVVPQAMVTTYTSSAIPPDFQKWLTDTIFVHYNRRLYKLLGPQFEGVFDLSTDSDSTKEK